MADEESICKDALRKERQKQKDANYYARHREKVKIKSRRWYQENKEYAKQRARDYKKSPAVKAKAREAASSFRKRFPEKSKGWVTRWWQKNPDKKKTYHRNRKARKRGNGGSHTSDDIADIFKKQRGRCAYCRAKLGKKRHVDHIAPLVRGGTNDRRNLQILCQDCNLAKHARDPLDHARSLGMLL